MGAMRATQRMTAEEFLALPETRQLARAELVAGELIVHEPALLHQHVLGRLFAAFDRWTSARSGRGTVTLPLDVRIDHRNVFAPDLLWYSRSAAPSVHAARPYPLPSLAVEVRSPSTWRYDVGSKMATYERAGLQELWLVDTAASEVLVFRRSAPAAPEFDVALELERGDTLSSPQLAGFELRLGAVFPPPE